MIKHVSLSLTIFLTLHSVSLSVECGAESVSLQQPNEHQSLSVDVSELERDLSIFSGYGTVKDFITDKKQNAVYNWIKIQSSVTKTNKKDLICFALGIDKETGFQSGFVSTDALKLILDALSSSKSPVKSLLQWMHDVLINPKKGFEAWNKKKEREEIYENFPLLSESVLSFPAFVKAIKNSKTIQNANKEFFNKIKEEQSNISQKLFSGNLTPFIGEQLEKYGDASLYFKLGSLVHGRKIKTDFNGQQISENDYCEVAAQYYREAIKRGGDEKSYANLATLIENSLVTKDASEHLISPGMHYEVAAECYRKAIKKGSDLCYGLFGSLIYSGHTTKDENGKSILPGMHYEVAAECYRKAIKKGDDASYRLLGDLIHNSVVKKDIDGNLISAEKRSEVAAQYYRKAIYTDKNNSCPGAYWNLGVLIHESEINTDINGQQISEKDRYEVAAQCYREAISKDQSSEGYYLLGLLILDQKVNKDLNKNPIINDAGRYEAVEQCYNLAIENEEKKDKNRISKERIEIYSGYLAQLYLLHDFKLSEDDRYKRIEDLSKKYGTKHSHILPLARTYFGRLQDGLEKWEDILIKEGCSSNQFQSKMNIEKALQKRGEKSEYEDQETSDEETSDNEIDTTISHDRHKGVLSDESKNDSSKSVLPVDLYEAEVRKRIETEEEMVLKT